MKLSDDSTLFLLMFSSTCLRFHTADTLFQMSVQDEGRDMWQVYLDMKEYAAALAHCRDPVERDQVYLVQVRKAILMFMCISMYFYHLTA